MDGLVEKVVDQIAQHIHPERIILFGSRANSHADPESDLDLLIVYSGSKSAREVQLDVHRLFAHPEFSLDVFVMTPEAFETQRNIANTLAREVHLTGRLCYG